MTIWADGDAISPDNMNNQHLSSLTVGSGDTSVGASVMAIQHDMGASDLAVLVVTSNSTVSGGIGPRGVEGDARFTHSSGSVGLGVAVLGAVVLGSSASITEARAVSLTFQVTGAGSVDTCAGLHLTFPSAVSVRELVGIDLHRGVNWSATTNHAVITNGVVSMVSSEASIPSAVSARGYLYASDIGALVWVGGSGTSTVIGAA